MQSRDGVSSVFAHEDWFGVEAVPVSSLFNHVMCDLNRRACVGIPPIVSVERYHIQVTALKVLIINVIGFVNQLSDVGLTYKS